MRSFEVLVNQLPKKAAAWLGGMNNDVARAWQECARAEWLLRMALLVEVERATVVHAAAELVSNALRARRVPDLRPNRAHVIACRWLGGSVPGSEAWASGFVAMQAAECLDDPRDVAAARAAAGLAFACDDLADATFYAHRAYAAVAAGEAARALECESSAADCIRRELPLSIFVDAFERSRRLRRRVSSYVEPASDAFYC